MRIQETVMTRLQKNNGQITEDVMVILLIVQKKNW